MSKEIVLISNFQQSISEDDLDDFLESLVESMQQSKVGRPGS